MTIRLNQHTYSWLWNVVSRHCELVYFSCCNIIKWPVKRTHIHRFRHVDHLFLQWSCDITRRVSSGVASGLYNYWTPDRIIFRIKNLSGFGFSFIFYSYLFSVFLLFYILFIFCIIVFIFFLFLRNHNVDWFVNIAYNK